MRQKKFKINDPMVTETLINKQLEKYKVTIKDIDFTDEENPWYNRYTFDSQEEYEAWKKFCINFLITQVTPKMSLKQAERNFMWFDLDYGLRHNYVIPTKKEAGRLQPAPNIQTNEL